MNWINTYCVENTERKRFASISSSLLFTRWACQALKVKVTRVSFTFTLILYIFTRDYTSCWIFKKKDTNISWCYPIYFPIGKIVNHFLKQNRRQKIFFSILQYTINIRNIRSSYSKKINMLYSHKQKNNHWTVNFNRLKKTITSNFNVFQIWI